MTISASPIPDTSSHTHSHHTDPATPLFLSRDSSATIDTPMDLEANSIVGEDEDMQESADRGSEKYNGMEEDEEEGARENDEEMEDGLSDPEIEESESSKESGSNSEEESESGKELDGSESGSEEDRKMADPTGRNDGKDKREQFDKRRPQKAWNTLLPIRLFPEAVNPVTPSKQKQGKRTRPPIEQSTGGSIGTSKMPRNIGPPKAKETRALAKIKIPPKQRAVSLPRRRIEVSYMSIAACKYK